MKKGAGSEKAYEDAQAKYSEKGVDTEDALRQLGSVSLSIPCWQGDDVQGFETIRIAGGGILATGNCPGRARSIGELRSDLELALSLIPGTHRVNLHAMYGDFGGKSVGRDKIEEAHFRSWIDWAREKGWKIDFNATCFGHPMAESGATLSSMDNRIRDYWIEHVRRCRAIGAAIGKECESPCIHNLWIPDGSKESPKDRWGPRTRLLESLDAVYSSPYDSSILKDSLESKLFGMGSESFVVGSHELYLAYALRKGIMVCLDQGHFHPTESLADKISSILLFSDEMLLHLSRGVRWDSDHVPILDDSLESLVLEIVRGDALGRIALALDFFDASINRIGAWVLGSRAVLKAILKALLEPRQQLQMLEEQGDFIGRLALLETVKGMPWGAIWDMHCQRQGVPDDSRWIDVIRDNERNVLSKRR